MLNEMQTKLVDIRQLTNDHTFEQARSHLLEQFDCNRVRVQTIINDREQTRINVQQLNHRINDIHQHIKTIRINIEQYRLDTNHTNELGVNSNDNDICQRTLFIVV
jgi:hypothetical protein